MLPRLNTLLVASTNVYGDMAVLLVDTTLDPNWPVYSDQDASLCSAFSGGCPAGASPIADAATFVGSNACACCTAVAGLRRDADGVCVDSTVG